MIKEITSPQNNKIKHATSLKLGKYRQQYQEFLAEGYKSLELALQAGIVKEIFTLKEIPNIKQDIVQYIVNLPLLKKLSSTQNPEGVVFVCLKQNKKPKKLDKVVYLDKISDPGNMGTIIRTAFAFNYDAVILSDECCDPYNEKVVAASKGAIFLIPVIQQDLSSLKEKRTIVVSTLSEKAQELNDVHINKPFVLVLGNEAHGVSESSLLLADVLVKIDISNIDSLNVSVAAGILMHHFR